MNLVRLNMSPSTGISGLDCSINRINHWCPVDFRIDSTGYLGPIRMLEAIRILGLANISQGLEK